MKTVTTSAENYRYKIVLSFAALLLIGASDGSYGVLLAGIIRQYAVDKSTVSFLFLAGALGYFIASFNNGLLLDKLGQRRFLVLALGIFALSTLTLSLAPPFLVLFALYLLLGFGVALMDAGLNAYIAGLPNNTALLNYLHAFYGAGAWLGPIVASTFLVLQWQWSSVYLLWCGVAIILAFMAALVFPKRVALSRQEQAERSGWSIAFGMRIVWLAALFLLFYVGAEVSLGSWTFSFLTEERHGSTLIAGWTVSGYWLGLMLGRLSLGTVAKRIGDRRLIELCLVGVVVGLLIVWLLPLEISAAAGFFLTGFSLGPIFPTTIALMSHVVEERVLPSAIGFMTSLGSAGAALFPWVAGNLAQSLGLWSLLPFAMILSVLMLGLWVFLQRQSKTAQVV